MSRKTSTTHINALFHQTRTIEPPAAEPHYTTEPQTRLVLGPFQLVLEHQQRDGTPALWVLPGGGRATTAQLLVIARRNGWKRPVQIQATVRRRVPGDSRRFVSQET
jgi:hypothetical protein